MNDNGEKRKDVVLQLFVDHKVIFGSIFVAWLLFFLLAIFVANDLSISWPPSMKLEELNSFGGNFNVLTSLFTGFAFAGLIISIIIQTKELKETRKEFEGQKLALEGQSFDNKFFQMLEILNNIKKNLKVSYSREGYDIFIKLHMELTLKILIEYRSNISEKDNFRHFEKVFEVFNDEYDTTFKYYYLNLYQILKYIDDKSPKDKVRFYSNIIRAQLSKNELVLLAYNAIGVQSFTSGKYKDFIEKYSFFEHLKYSDFIYDDYGKEMDVNMQAIIKSILVKYDKSAFGDNQDFIDLLGKS